MAINYRLKLGIVGSVILVGSFDCLFLETKGENIEDFQTLLHIVWTCEGQSHGSLMYGN